jgi:uncharacterized protein
MADSNSSTGNLVGARRWGCRPVWPTKVDPACPPASGMILSGSLEPTDPEPVPAAPLPLPLLPPPHGGGILPDDATDRPIYIPLNYDRPYLLPRGPRVWTVFLAFAAGVAAIIFAGIVVPVTIIAIQYHGHFESPDQLTDVLRNSIYQPIVLLATGAAGELLVLIVVLSAVMFSRTPMRERLRLNRATLSISGYVIVVIGTRALTFLFGTAVQLLGIEPQGTMKLFSEVFQRLTPLEVAVAVFAVGVMPGIAEEFLCRGYIQTRLSRRWGRWPAILITALLFGIMHFDVQQGIYAALLGMFLGYVVEQAGSIRPSIICHMINNSVGVVLGWWFSGGGEPSARATAMFAAVCAGILGLVILYLRYRVRPPSEPPDPSPPDFAAEDLFLLPPPPRAY